MKESAALRRRFLASTWTRLILQAYCPGQPARSVTSCWLSRARHTPARQTAALHTRLPAKPGERGDAGGRAPAAAPQQSGCQPSGPDRPECILRVALPGMNRFGWASAYSLA